MVSEVCAAAAGLGWFSFGIAGTPLGPMRPTLLALQAVLEAPSFVEVLGPQQGGEAVLVVRAGLAVPRAGVVVFLRRTLGHEVAPLLGLRLAVSAGLF